MSNSISVRIPRVINGVINRLRNVIFYFGSIERAEGRADIISACAKHSHKGAASVRGTAEKGCIDARGRKSGLKNSMLIRAFDTREVAYVAHVQHEGHGLYKDV